ncbi:hypothetical protein BH789_gp066 [Gordonia phage GMA6]|uniref:Uncharacterized protein n=1 Tax=Gordonia phage GMA6 TaxID=1647285 RepID=A0A0K0NLB6_9CAUD|nr:hypothetical protein BH789_gp066 [Gordonia phage GMA6]AKL88347.1 hypothetical protein GMA6_66 [Gordonia phage GMA6]
MTDTMHTVRMGTLNRFNGPCLYSFPTRKAAVRFATTHAQIAPGRVVIVKDPSGRIIKRFGKRRSLAPKGKVA